MTTDTHTTIGILRQAVADFVNDPGTGGLSTLRKT